MDIDAAIKIMAKTRAIKLDPKMFDVFALQFKKYITKEKLDFKMADDFDSEKPYTKFPLIPVDSKQEVNFVDEGGKKRKSTKVSMFGPKKKKAS